MQIPFCETFVERWMNNLSEAYKSMNWHASTLCTWINILILQHSWKLVWETIWGLETEYLNSMSKAGLDEAFQGIKSSFQPDYMFLKTLNLDFTQSGTGF